ncbi:hypothetical protein K2173_001064 [Erythroxylum novogranatense]|uniref:Uncharacterized protein n=1 Tax=Erythroxylum novogranatense TaxID=1862640 RepID=A0AAV8SIJ4_9ROSI|nr:hypothetical protein K2173_001064 [Erythroxylum novogranatense]
MMEMRFNRVSSRESSLLQQKKLTEPRRSLRADHAPDLTDFMNDMFFGALNSDAKAYNLTGHALDGDEESFDQSTRSNNSRLTQEWLNEARRMVASSPARADMTPARLAGSPRFNGGIPGRLSTSSIEIKDHLSRSARRNRALDGLSEEILTRTVNHSRSNSSDVKTKSPSEAFPVSQVHNWVSDVLNPSSSTLPPDPINPCQGNNLFHEPTAPPLPPRSSIHRKSRFQTDTQSSPTSQGIPVPPRRNFKSAADSQLLSPPKNLVESAHRRSISKSTCSMEKIAPNSNANGWQKEGDGQTHLSLNSFLKEQRTKIGSIMNNEIQTKAKIILPGPSNSTSSMVAAICYACWLNNKFIKKKGKSEGDEEGSVVLPVMNIRRSKMWKQRQAAWLFHHVGLDATSLLFADEVDLESLLITGRLTVLVVGQDILKNNAEAGSMCTTLTDNYCEDAYDLLQTPELKKLLLSGILLDTHNLGASNKPTTRDSEAVQLLQVGLAPNYRTALFEQLVKDRRDSSFFEALRRNYGRPPSDSNRESIGQMENRVTERRSISTSPHEDGRHNPDQNSHEKVGTVKRDAPKSAKQTSASAPTAVPVQAAPDASKGKNKFFLAKIFGFGSK